MARGNEKFLRRQKEIERQKAATDKRVKRADRKAHRTGAAAGDEEVAAIQAALDAGENPGAADERSDEEAPPPEGE